MGISEILASVDRQIALLQQARSLLSGGAATGKRRVGRPRKSESVGVSASASSGKKKRNLTPEGRKRIADAVKRRWAAQKKASGGGK
jgi:hypothetical protein